MWVADVFGRERAEQIELDDIALIFHRTRQMDVLERPENHVILGAKGSGKSTVLRALTWRTWTARSPGLRLPFLGIYVPMSYEEVQPFCLAYTERQNAELFEHFFVCTFLRELCIQLQQVSFAEAALPTVLPNYVKSNHLDGAATLAELAQVFVDDRHTILRSIRKSASGTTDGLSLKTTELLTVHAIAELADRLTLIRAQHADAPSKLAVLLDSFDYYGLLGHRIAPLLQSDMGPPLVVKVAARTLDTREILGSTQTRPLEMGRDYDVLSLDRLADDEEHLSLTRQALCKRVRTLGPELARALPDEQIIDALFGDSGKDTRDLASLNSFVRLSSGNVLAVILLLEGAARLQREKSRAAPEGLEPLRREFRLRAVHNASDLFWSNEIGVRVPHHKHEAIVFCETCLDIARSKHPHLAESPTFELESVSRENSLLLKNMLASRVLTATESETNKQAQCFEDISGKVSFELNRTLLPKYGLFPREGKTIELEARQFGRKYRAALKARKPFLSPRSNHSQQELFRAGDFNVFVSLPFDRTKRSRTQVVRAAINRLYEEKTGRVGAAGVSFTDIHWIPPVGAFRYEIPNYIRESTYVVADISELGVGINRSPGVFYEIGLAVALKKPLAFFYNCRDSSEVPPFDAERLPTILRGQTVLVWQKSSPPFFDEFNKIHQKLSGYSGAYDRPLDAPALPSGGVVEPGHAYLSFQPRNSAAQSFCERLLRQLFPGLRIETARSWQADDATLLVELVSKAAIRIIDCTDGVSAQALELGIAAADDPRRTIEVWDIGVDRRFNPVAMFPGRRFSWTGLGADDERNLSSTLLNIGGSSYLGALRP